MKNILSSIVKRITVLCGCGFLMLFWACDGDIRFGEQYKKTIYLVRGNNLLYTKDHFYGAENDKLVFSVYCASSEPTKEDVTVELKIDPHALDSLNAQRFLESSSYIFKEMLPEANYQAPAQLKVTIPAGKQYGLLEIPFNSEGLDPDVFYALPISIVSNSRGYEQIPRAMSVVYEVRLINKYSGIFTGTAVEAPLVAKSLRITLKPLSKNQVRMPIHDLNDNATNLDTNFMMLTIAKDGQVSISPWANAQVVDLGDNFFDEVRQAYELHYRYTNPADGKVFTIQSKIANIDAPKLVQ